ncbi:MAG: DUF5615 family PIN-like protein [Azospirillaceae bacterium]
MRFFIDECVSPGVAALLAKTGEHVAFHPLHLGRLGEPDHVVLDRAIAEAAVIVTFNGRDFRALCRRSDIHPGLVILPQGSRVESFLRLLVVIERVCAFNGGSLGNDALVNHVAEFEADGSVSISPLP